MKYIVEPSRIGGLVSIPASKSHSIRALLIALLAQGKSSINNLLQSDDVTSCLHACETLGAGIKTLDNGDVELLGTGGALHKPVSLFLGNSGTGLYFFSAAAALYDKKVQFDGDDSLRKRSAAELLSALQGLGARTSTKSGLLPYSITGPLRGGRVSISCPTSQYLSALLLTLPLAQQDSYISVLQLNEIPYVSMTLKWLEGQNIALDYAKDYSWFSIRGGQNYSEMQVTIPADASSATFWLCAAAIAGGKVGVVGLDPNDVQGDLAVADVLAAMGAQVSWQDDGAKPVLYVAAAPLRGGTFDLNSMPDSLPALMATACYAHEKITFTNISHARLKETDRISVMSNELKKMGAHIESMQDSVTIYPSKLQGSVVQSHGDHRVAMALSIAALQANGESCIEGSECVRVTYPEFFTHLEQLRNIAS